MFNLANSKEKLNAATGRLSHLLRWLLPNGGTLLVVGLLLATQSVWARGRGGPAVPSISTTTISYQGRLADSDGEPLTGSYDMVFRLYDAPSGGAAVWEESWTGSDAVAAAEGLFHVMLGSLNPDLASVVNTYDELYLGVTVGTDAEMAPRVQLGSVPFALRAMTVAADSITAVEIAAGAVGSSELADGSVTTAKIADGAINYDKLAPGVLSETVYTFELAGWTITTSTITVTFGTIDLTENSDLQISSMWVLQNNSSEFGLRASLVIDDMIHSIYADSIALPSAGLGFTVARNHYVPNVSAGSHTFAVRVDQFSSGYEHEIGMGPDSIMWIRVIPTGQ